MRWLGGKGAGIANWRRRAFSLFSFNFSFFFSFFFFLERELGPPPPSAQTGADKRYLDPEQGALAAKFPGGQICPLADFCGMAEEIGVVRLRSSARMRMRGSAMGIWVAFGGEGEIGDLTARCSGRAWELLEGCFGYERSGQWEIERGK